jgi:hypothetical protein
MASTAIPVIFPHQKIQNHIGDFIDGGRKGVFDEFETNFGLISKNNGQFDDLHIISPMRKYVKFDYSITKSKIEKNNLMVIAEIIRMRLFITFLKDLHKFNSELRLAKNIYVSIPNLNERFPLITFDYQKEQYDKVFAWFTTNPNELAIPLEAFLKSVK